MKKILVALICLIVSFVGVLVVDLTRPTVDVVIYSAMEDFRNEKLREMLKENFPDYSIEVQYMPSGTLASRVKAEKSQIPADIVLDVDYGYTSALSDYLADLSAFNEGQFLPELLMGGNKYFPLSKYGIGVMYNPEILSKNGLPAPTSYQDLLKPIYRKMISMPSPKASGTAYGFVKGMVNLMGYQEAFQFFDKLDANIIQYTSSGSGPVNNLVRGECGIGIGMIFQGVKEINKGAKIVIPEFSDGVSYNVSSCCIIKGKDTKARVREVFSYFISEYLNYDKKYFMPEQIFIDQEKTAVVGFPELKYINMAGIESLSEKERILNEWKF